MLAYSGTKETFIKAVENRIIAREVEKAIEERFGNKISPNEFTAFENSLPKVSEVLQLANLDKDVEVAIEFKLPISSRRVDFMIAGLDENDKPNVVIIELKQWTKAQRTSRDGVVTTFLQGANRATVHPSYQAYAYAKTIENYNATVQDENIKINPCAYLHNYDFNYRNEIDNGLYFEIIEKSPLYIKEEEKQLALFINKFVKKSDRNKLLYKIDDGKIRPSKALQDAISNMMKGNQEFLLIDEQKVAYETINKRVKNALENNKRATIIVTGGAGTGKSVIAINLLYTLTKEGFTSSYVTKNKAPRDVYFEQLCNDFKESYVKNLFKSSQSFEYPRTELLDCLIVDEAHRLTKHFSHNQIDDIIRSSKVNVFFIDETQQVTTKDIGTIDNIKMFAKSYNSEVFMDDDLKLVSQFRCNGSDNYVLLVENMLGMGKHDYIDKMDYDIRLYEDPTDMKLDLLEKNNINNKARMVAGYCYEWVTRDNPNSNQYDIVLKNGFKAKWNFMNQGIFATDTRSFNQVGCIHTTQGLEFDYVGVILGKDLIYKDGNVLTDKTKNAVSDTSSHIRTAPDDLADKLIRNTYKTLLTRGQKGCFVFCEDDELRDYFLNTYKEKITYVEKKKF